MSTLNSNLFSANVYRNLPIMGATEAQANAAAPAAKTKPAKQAPVAVAAPAPEAAPVTVNVGAPPVSEADKTAMLGMIDQTARTLRQAEITTAENLDLQRRLNELEATNKAIVEARTKAEADVKAAQDALAEANKKLESGTGSPAGLRLATKIGEDPLKSAIDKLDKAKTVKEAREIGYELTEDAVKKLLEKKDIEGVQRDVVHFEKRNVIIGVTAAVVVAAVGTAVVGYVAYQAGDAAGRDAASTIKFDMGS